MNVTEQIDARKKTKKTKKRTEETEEERENEKRDIQVQLHGKRTL